MANNKKIYLIGGSIIAFAAVIVLLSVFVPRIVHKNKMADLLAEAVTPARLSVGDPLYQTGDLLGNTGKEVLVEGEARTAITNLLQTLREEGYRTDGTEKMPAGTLDLNVKVRTAAGGIVNLWFTETNFYYIDGTTAAFFEAKNESAYHELYQRLKACLS